MWLISTRNLVYFLPWWVILMENYGVVIGRFRCSTPVGLKIVVLLCRFLVNCPVANEKDVFWRNLVMLQQVFDMSRTPSLKFIWLNHAHYAKNPGLKNKRDRHSGVLTNRITRNLYLTFSSMYYLSLDVESWICGSPRIAGESQSSVSYSGHDGSWQTGMSCLKTFLFLMVGVYVNFLSILHNVSILCFMSRKRLFVISFPV